jgi:tRNA1(Val) A37 N6-methylase TrmN6
MPIPETTPEMAIDADSVSGQMSRRSVLKGAGVGAAGLAVTALGGAQALAAVRRPAEPATPAQRQVDDAAAGESVVVHVRDVRNGQIDVSRSGLTARSSR